MRSKVQQIWYTFYPCKFCKHDTIVVTLMVTAISILMLIIIAPFFSIDHNIQVSALSDINNKSTNILQHNESTISNNITSKNNFRSDYNTIFNEGLALLNSGNYTEALAAFKKAIYFDPNHANAWNNRGQALDKLGRYNEALASFDKALSINSTISLIWSNKGTVLYELGRYDDALASFDKAISIEPTNPAYYQYRNSAIRQLEFSTPNNNNNTNATSTKAITGQTVPSQLSNSTTVNQSSPGLPSSLLTTPTPSSSTNTNNTQSPIAPLAKSPLIGIQPGVQENKSSQNSITMRENNTAAKNNNADDLLTFENPKCGFTIHYLKNWTLSTNDQCDIEFDVPDSSSNTNLDVQSTTNETRSLDQIVSDAIGFAKQDTKNFHVVESSDIIVNGSPAHMLGYTWHAKGESDIQGAKEILILNGSTSYDITYNPDAGEYDKYLPAVQQMINSFSVTKSVLLIIK